MMLLIGMFMGFALGSAGGLWLGIEFMRSPVHNHAEGEESDDEIDS